MKIGLRILTLLVVAFLAALPVDAFAQLDARDIARSQRAGQGNALGGSNPFDTRQEGEEGDEQRDSTRVRRDRKPLESYYFNDSIRALPNFMWTVDRDMNDVEIMPLDTTLSNWRIDHPYQLKGVGDMTLGGLGQSTLPFNYFDRPTSSDFSFAQSYDSYTYRMDNVPFYNSKTPYLNFTYLESGQKR